MRSPIVTTTTTTLTLGIAGLLVACASAPAPTSSTKPVDPFGHVHALVAQGAETLVATHTGVYLLDEKGAVTGPLGGFDFDAMGFTATADSWFASGHPGPATPPELGAPNLGVISSDDEGDSWASTAFTGIEDFHILTADANGTLYGIGSSSPALRTSRDGGVTWTDGAVLGNVADVAVSAGTVYAATESGLLRSADGGETFAPVADAPLLYSLETFGGRDLVAVSSDGVLWRLTAAGGWEGIGNASGRVQAISGAAEGAVLLADDRGIVRIAPDSDQPTILHPSAPAGADR